MITLTKLENCTRVFMITLDRPERKNALTVDLWKDLAVAVRDAETAGARAIVVTGAGEVFCAGADIAQADGKMAEMIEQTFATIRESRMPVIAFINGAAVGAGAQLAVSCDLRVVSQHARFRIPVALINLLVHPGTIERLKALAGVGPTRAMLLGGDWIDAKRAYALGLADREGNLETAIAWASEIAGYAPLALQYLKQQLQIPNPPESGAYFAALHAVLESEDHAEAVLARKEHRSPSYTGK